MIMFAAVPGGITLLALALLALALHKDRQASSGGHRGASSGCLREVPINHSRYVGGTFD